MIDETDKVRNVLVTGASGFVGKWLVAALKETSAPGRMRIFGADREAEAQNGIVPVKLDITDRVAVQRTISEIIPDVLIHLAGIAAPAIAKADPARAWSVNVFGTMNLAEAVLRAAPAARFIFAGSSEIYGKSFNDSPAPLDERALLQPIHPYATTKAAADLVLAQMAHEGLHCVRFRPFNHTGPRQKADYVVPAFARQIARIEKGLQAPVIEVGNLDAERDFLDVRDVVKAYVEAAIGAQKLVPGQILNLASGRLRRIGWILDELRSLSTVEVEVRVSKDRYRPNEIPKASGNANNAISLLGWQPLYKFERTIRDVLTDWRCRC